MPEPEMKEEREMRLYIDKIWQKRFFITILICAGVLWISGRPGMASEKAESGSEPIVVGQQEVLYRDSGDEIAVLGKDIQFVTYSSSNTDVAVVSKDGIVSGVDPGNTEIHVKVEYEKEGKLLTKELSYGLKVLDNFTNYFDVFDGYVSDITEKGKTLKEMYIPDYCNYIKVKGADWIKLIYGNHVVEKIFLPDFMEVFSFYGSRKDADAPRKLREIYFGKDMEYFQDLKGASAMERIIVHPSNQHFQVKDDVLFCGNTLVYYPPRKADTFYAVPQNVKQISTYAFAGAGVKEVSIPPKTEMYGRVFYNCGKLEKVLLPDRLYDETVVFYRCPALKTVIVPNTSRGTSAYNFRDCPSLQEFQVSAGASDFQVEDGVLFQRSIHALAAYPAGKKNTAYTVPAGIKRIDSGAFYGASNLKSIKLDGALTWIGYHAFENCRSLVKIHIPRRVKYIHGHMAGEQAGLFRECNSLKKITVDSQNKYFASSKGVLYNKSGKILLCYPQGRKGSKFIVPKGVTTIRYCAFADARILRQVVMGNHVKTIESQAFSHAEALRSVTLPGKLKKMSSRTFVGCKKLTKVVIPDKVPTLRYRTFVDCISLREVVLGKAVREIEDEAFSNCKSLRKVTFRGKKWQSRIIYNDDKDEEKKPFYRAGSKNYRKLVIHVPKSTKAQKKKSRKLLGKLGLHKNAKIKFAKR